MPPEFREKIKERAANMIQELSTDARFFFHHHLDAKKHTEEDVKTVIDAFPSALSYNEGGYLPIERAVLNLDVRNLIPFVPLFAEEGAKLNVGGEGQRGGLLLEEYRCGHNVLKEITVMGSNHTHDSMCLDALKRLRESDLLKKEDIREYDLLNVTCKPLSKERFEYLVDWDPEGLKEYLYDNGNPFLHAKTMRMNSFTMALKAGLKHYPEDLGFLFRKNERGKTACEMASEQHGKDRAWRAIEKCFEDANDVKMVERNPETNLYPFMLAATSMYPLMLAKGGKKSNLNALFYLLRRNPGVLEGFSQVQGLDDFDACVEKKCKHAYDGKMTMAIATFSNNKVIEHCRKELTIRGVEDNDAFRKLGIRKLKEKLQSLVPEGTTEIELMHPDTVALGPLEISAIKRSKNLFE